MLASVLLPLLAALAAARGPMALVLRSVYDYYIVGMMSPSLDAPYLASISRGYPYF
jgi:hypothetical protein